MKSILQKLQFGCSIIALAAASGFFPQMAQAQDANAVESVTVTGTSIRGVAPVGSNLITVSPEDIRKTGGQTVQQVLANVPAVTGMGNSGEGGSIHNNYYQPSIHQLGASASNATLVLIDGHRPPTGGTNHSTADPNILPANMLERVEVIANGTSSIYGSDAVAGVINFITRKKFDGIQLTGESAFTDGATNENLGVLAGSSWAGGSVIFAYQFYNAGQLLSKNRPYTYPDQTARAAASGIPITAASSQTNFNNFNCATALVRVNGAGNYYDVSNGTQYSTAQSAAPCNTWGVATLLPSEQRNNAMLKVRQDVGDRLTLGLDAVYSRVSNRQAIARGTLTTTVFRTGPQANPFYANPPGIIAGTPAGDSQQVRWDADELLGPGATSFNNATDYYVSGTLEYRLGDNFRITGLGLFGREDSFVGDQGRLCVSCANLALNGTTNSGGDPAKPSIPGTTTIVTGFPLDPGNALDVWNPVGSNRTSDAVLAELTDNHTQSRWYYSISQFRLGTDGALFDLPGGAVRIAVGGEYVHYGLDINRTRPNNTGPSSTGSEFFHLPLQRNVESAFGELLVPIVGAANALPFVQSLNLSLSARYDHYSGIGSTTNPHVALDWEVVDGLKLRGNYSRSFVAPQLTSVGDQSRDGLTSFSGYGASNQTLIVPIANFPLASQIPGVTCNGTTCTVGSSVNGVAVNGGPADPRPGKGISWSVGVDLVPRSMPGFRASVTLFNNKLINQITGTSASNAINSAALNSNLQFFPNGATQADIAAVAGNFPQNSVIGSPVYYILSVRQQNVLNLDIQGLDASANYDISTDRAGTFHIGGSVTYFTRFDQSLKGGPTFSVLNTTGFNNTFPSIQTQARGNVGWDIGDISANAFVNFIGGYRNWSGSTVDPLVSENGIPVSGGDHVAATALVDLNVAYTLHGDALDGSQVFLDITNLFDRNPSFYNSANGYDPYSGNVIGRVVTLGFRAKL